ncbi:MAG: YbaB/EbfC family nucleoid-associated protein [Planctomycetota bacterium]|nr:MAG: YbaB/EbfC family nucleoid-associated protein [Planctomycetota bacterium]REJ95716.1 MAG: YbaB/EbfC family nucleoid-associated protein [Planctomycetota bacterium]REK23412.1 MAG: YbaB/EbfC family nucleoid-associated protein [Planctomycetota bacterium]REK38951.1 MAG: YbaB/EbfC family nucleoid-associated protein [Planctomycetota bacterium]
MFKGLNGLMQAVKQAQQIQGRVGEIQEKLAAVRVEGSAGGGMVTVEADGQQRLVSCRIEPSLVAGGDHEMLEELLIAASNQALERSKEAAAEAMSGMVEGIDLPGLQESMSQFNGLSVTGDDDDQ